MIGWLEESWSNVILVCTLALVAVVVLWAAVEALPLRREQPPHSSDCELCAVGDRSHDG